MWSHYQPAWEKLPELAGWLRAAPSGGGRAYCAQCRCELTANLALLRAHARAAHAPAARLRQFRPSWRRLPELAGWLRRSPADRRHAFCAVCNKELLPTLAKLRRHAACPLHRRRAGRGGAASPAERGGADDAADAGDGAVDSDGVDGDGGAASCGAADEAAGAAPDGALEDWRRRPEFAGWLRRSAADRRRAFCLVCFKEMTAKLAHVRRHGRCVRHQRLARRAAAAGAPPAGPRQGTGSEGASEEPEPEPDEDLEDEDWRTGEESEAACGWPAPGRPPAAGPARYSPAWEQLPELRQWLASCPGEPRRAFCRLCRRAVTAKLAHLRRHAASSRHRQCAPSPDDPPAAGDGDGSDGGERGGGTRPLPYRACWERRPELRAWLRRSPWDRQRPFCVVCRRQVTGKLAHLRRHAAGERHRRLLLEPRPEPAPCEEPEPEPEHEQEQEPEQERELVMQWKREQEQERELVIQWKQDQEQERERERERSDGEAGSERDTPPVADVEPELGPFGTCLVCKHPLVVRLNIFRTRTKYSRTLLASKLSRLVQHTFKEETLEPSSAEICVSCVSLVNQVDECETRLTALENEVKLKFKMPCPLSVRGRVASSAGVQPAEADSAGVHESGAVAAAPSYAVVEEDEGAADPLQLAEGPKDATVVGGIPVAYVTIGERGADGATIVLPEGSLDAADMVVYRDPDSESATAAEATTIYWADVSGLADHEEMLSHEASRGAQEEMLSHEASGGAQEEMLSHEASGGAQEEMLSHEASRGAQEEMLSHEAMAGGGGGGRLVWRSAAVERTDGEQPPTCAPPAGQNPSLEEQILQPAKQSLSAGEQRLSPGEQSLLTAGGAGKPSAFRRRAGRRFCCTFCGSQLPTGLALHQHWNQDHPLRLQPCPYCQKRFLYRSSLKQHIRTHQEQGFPCELCGRQFAARSDLAKHKVFRHSSERRFPCGECGRAFKLKWMVARHRRLVHGGDWPVPEAGRPAD